jgi:YbbR domain-containing protein
MTVGLNLPKGITSDVKTVKVTIRVEELQKKKIIINIDNIDNPDGLEYELARQEIEVDIEGPNSVVKDTHRGTGSVSLKGLAPGKYTLPVKIEGLPSEVTVLGNLTVEVTIK